MVLIRGVFFQLPPGSGVTQREPIADMNNLSHHPVPLKEAMSVGPLTKKFGDHLEKGWGGLQLVTEARPPLGGN